MVPGGLVVYIFGMFQPPWWLGLLYEIGRAKRGVSGTLYSQSATARLNSFPRVGSVESLLP